MAAFQVRSIVKTYSTAARQEASKTKKMPGDVNKKDDNGGNSKLVGGDKYGDGLASEYDEKEGTPETGSGTISTRLTTTKESSNLFASVIEAKGGKEENAGPRLASVQRDHGNQSDADDDSETATCMDSILPGAVAVEGRDSCDSGAPTGHVGSAGRRGRHRTPSPPTPPPTTTTTDMEQNTAEPKILVQAEIAPDVEQAIAVALAEHERKRQANIVSAVEICPLPDNGVADSNNNNNNNSDATYVGKFTSSWTRIFLLLIVAAFALSAVVVGIAFIASKDTGKADNNERDDFLVGLPTDADDEVIPVSPTASPILTDSMNALQPSADTSPSANAGVSGENLGGGGMGVGMMVPMNAWPTIDNSGQNCISEDYIKIATTKIASQTIAIVNPNQGPNYDNAWTKQSYDVCISYLRDHGVKVIGYVTTKSQLEVIVDSSDISSKSSRDVVSVLSDIDAWFEEYDGIQGVFIDDVNDLWSWEEFGWDSLDAMVDYNHALVDHILAKSEDSYAVMNPAGAYPASLMEPYYGNRRVIAVVFESTQSEYQPGDCVDQLWTSESGSFSKG